MLKVIQKSARFVRLGLVLTLAVIAAPTSAATSRGAALVQIDGLIQNIEAIRDSVHAQHEARMFLIEKESRELRQSIQDRDLMNGQTIQFYHRLLIRFLYSQDFFSSIRTKRNGQAIDTALATIAEIRLQMGAPDDQYTKILKNNLSQMEVSLRELIKYFTDNSTAQSLPLLGALIEFRKYLVLVAIPEADQGDRPSKNQSEIVRRVYKTLKDLYPMLHEFGEQSPCFEKVSELIGANEFIHDFGQIRLDEKLSGSNP